ncbi:hypothetical protein D9M69_575220 [compost metagenome]
MVNQRISGYRYRHRIGQHHRRFKISQLLHLADARQLAKAIGNINGGGHFFLENISGMREDSGNTGADPFARHKRFVTHLYPGNIRNGIVFSRCKHPDPDPQISYPLSR